MFKYRELYMNIISKKIIKFSKYWLNSKNKNKNANLKSHDSDFYDQVLYVLFKIYLKFSVSRVFNVCIFMRNAIYVFEIGWFHSDISRLANLLVLNTYYKVNIRLSPSPVFCQMSVSPMMSDVSENKYFFYSK